MAINSIVHLECPEVREVSEGEAGGTRIAACLVALGCIEEGCS